MHHFYEIIKVCPVPFLYSSILSKNSIVNLTYNQIQFCMLGGYAIHVLHVRTCSFALYCVYCDRILVCILGNIITGLAFCTTLSLTKYW